MGAPDASGAIGLVTMAFIQKSALADWLREQGEQAMSEPGGASCLLEVNGSAIPLRFLWGRLDRPTVEVFTTVSPLLDEGVVPAFAKRVLDINRAAWKTGAWLHMAGGKSVSARAAVFLVEDRASAEGLRAAIDSIRQLVETSEFEFRHPIDETVRYKRLQLGAPTLEYEPSELVAQIDPAALVRRGIALAMEGRWAQLSSERVPPFDAVNAARVAGNTAATALYLDGGGTLRAGLAVPLEVERERGLRAVELALECMRFDVEWMATT